MESPDLTIAGSWVTRRAKNKWTGHRRRPQYNETAHRPKALPKYIAKYWCLDTHPPTNTEYSIGSFASPFHCAVATEWGSKIKSSKSNAL